MKQITFTPEELKHQANHAGTYDITREWNDNWQGVEVRNYRAIREGCSNPQYATVESQNTRAETARSS